MADGISPAMSTVAQNGNATQAESPVSSTSEGKRKADSEPEEVGEQLKKLKKSEESDLEDNHEDDDQTSAHPGQEDGENDQEQENKQPKLSKNQLKRLKRKEAYEAFKAGRKEKRKEKRHEKQAKKRAEKEAKIAEAVAAGIDPATVLQAPPPFKPTPVPVAFLIDCGDFEKYMREPEIVSLSSQITRAYSQNRRAKYPARLCVAGFGGALKTRFETVLKNAHENWRDVVVTPSDFKTAADHLKGIMLGEPIDLIKPSEDEQPAPEEPELAPDVDQAVVYLTSESPYTLERLEANTVYVIGGIVDRNREKGLCYNRAKENKVRTAKLPIGEYMAMQSRYVLTTNQVVEIMAKWLECGDWGEAFMGIIPKRKGGTLKNGEAASTPGEDQDHDDDDEGEENTEGVAEETGAVEKGEDAVMANTA
ncbi:tRNA (Guanine-1)-methyltransferase domain containing protein [Naviculisporaceae sp. PSN 640]